MGDGAKSKTRRLTFSVKVRSRKTVSISALRSRQSSAEDIAILDNMVTRGRGSFGESRPSASRRVSEPRAQGLSSSLKPAGYFRRASMTDFIHLKKHLNLPPYFPKAAPAQPVLTAFSVQVTEAPALSPVYDDTSSVGNSHAHGKRAAVKISQIVRSAATTYQMIWEDSPCSSLGDEDPLLGYSASSDSRE